MRWARAQPRALLRRRPSRPAGLFGIVQGGMYADLRLASLEALLRLDWPGLAIGGLAVGEPEEERLRVLEALVPHMPADRPRYLMGVGRPEDIVAAVLRGVDMFDCVMPTRHARNGHLFTAHGRHQHPQRAAPARTSARWTRPAAAIPAATTRAPTCGTSTAATRSSARGSTPSTTCTSTCELMRATARRHRAPATLQRLGRGTTRQPGAQAGRCGIMPPFSLPGATHMNALDLRRLGAGRHPGCAGGGQFQRALSDAGACSSPSSISC